MPQPTDPSLRPTTHDHEPIARRTLSSERFALKHLIESALYRDGDDGLNRVRALVDALAAKMNR